MVLKLIRSPLTRFLSNTFKLNVSLCLNMWVERVLVIFFSQVLLYPFFIIYNIKVFNQWLIEDLVIKLIRIPLARFLSNVYNLKVFLPVPTICELQTSWSSSAVKCRSFLSYRSSLKGLQPKTNIGHGLKLIRSHLTWFLSKSYILNVFLCLKCE